jgi:plastocyanin
MLHFGWLLVMTLMTVPAAKRHTVTMSAFQFAPRELQVTVGDTVVFDNRDIVPHTATAVAGWDTGNISAKSTGHMVALRKGEYTYACLYHSNMKGKLIVK